MSNKCNLYLNSFFFALYEQIRKTKFMKKFNYFILSLFIFALEQGSKN